MSRGEYFLEIPTPFLRRTFGLAMSRQGEAQQDTTFFRILNGHLSFREAGRWLFGDYAHNRLSELEREPLKAYSPDGTVYHIPVPAKMIVGFTALKNIQPPHNFYWRPVKPNFKGINALIRSGNNVWALQYMINKFATDGLIEIRDRMNHKEIVKWHLVVVGPNLSNAKAARNEQRLGSGWKWPTVVCVSELPMGQFNEEHAQYLKTILNDVST